MTAPAPVAPLALVVIAAIVILDNMGVNVTGLVAGLGIGGIAIGLAIAKGFVEAMGGRIAVTSQPGEGSTFTVTLPLTCAQAARHELERGWQPRLVLGHQASQIARGPHDQQLHRTHLVAFVFR